MRELPIWYSNLLWMIESEPKSSVNDRTDCLTLMLTQINKWLDETLVVGNLVAENVCRSTLSWFPGDLRLIVANSDDHQLFLSVCSTYRRLRGLVK